MGEPPASKRLSEAAAISAAEVAVAAVEVVVAVGVVAAGEAEEAVAGGGEVAEALGTGTVSAAPGAAQQNAARGATKNKPVTMGIIRRQYAKLLPIRDPPEASGLFGCCRILTDSAEEGCQIVIEIVTYSQLEANDIPPPA
jgi:hypothetical protein